MNEIEMEDPHKMKKKRKYKPNRAKIIIFIKFFRVIERVLRTCYLCAMLLVDIINLVAHFHFSQVGAPCADNVLCHWWYGVR